MPRRRPPTTPQLRQTATTPPAPPVAAGPVDAELSRLFRKTEQDPSAVHSRVSPLKRKRKVVRRILVLGGIVLAGLIALGVFVWGEVGARRPHAPGPAGSPTGPTLPEPTTPNRDPGPHPDSTAAPPSPATSPGGTEPSTTQASNKAPPAVNVGAPPDHAAGNPPEANAPSPFSEPSASPLGFDEEDHRPGSVPTEEAPGPKEAKAKRPPPSDEVRKRIAGRMDDTFHFSKSRTPDEQVKLAEELLQRAGRPDCDADERFVLLGKAAEAARDSGDAAMMLRAVNARADEFDVDVLAERLDGLTTFAKGAKDAGSIRSLVLEVEPVLDQAAGANRYDDAAELARAVHEACKRAQGKDFRAWAKRLHEEIQRLRKQCQAVQQAAETLKTAPTDGDAHLLLGRWHCFERDEWSVGLPHLRDGSDPALQALARRELDAPPAAPDDQVALGDAWWDLAQQTKPVDKEPLLRRAGHWYRTALPRVADSVKEKLNGRLEEIPEPASTAGGLRRAGLGDLLDKPGASKTPGQTPKRGRTIQCRIFAAADDEFVMCVNGEEILRGQDHTRLFAQDFALAKRDVITVRVSDRGGAKGFCCVILSEKGQAIATGFAWRSYQPQSETEWADPRQIKSANPVIRADDSSSKLVFKACGIKAMDIWGASNPSYLAFEVR